MAQIPRILKNFTLFVDGRGLAGTIETLTLPTLTTKMEEVRAGGMDAPIEHDMGMEKLEASFDLLEFNPDIIALYGLASADQQLTARGAMRADGADAVAIVVNWKAGDPTKPKFSVGLRYYKLTIGGRELIEIDKVNMIRKINGVDQLATIRQAIGV
jgi:P2 family phage contractile tail tube protein